MKYFFQQRTTLLISLIFIFTIKLAFAEKISLLEKIYIEKNLFFTFSDQKKHAIKLVNKLINNPSLDKDFRKLEINIGKGFLIKTSKPYNNIIFLCDNISKDDIQNEFLNALQELLLAEQLLTYSINEVQVHCDNALKILKKTKYSNLRSEIYALKASAYYKKRNYFQAIKCYNNCTRLLKLPSTFKTTIYNNLSLCYFNILQFKKALKANNVALSTLEKSKKQTEWNYLKALIIANRGEFYLKLEMKDEAQNDLEYFFSYAKKNNKFLENIPKKLLLLYEIYNQKVQNNEKKSEIVNYLYLILKTNKDIEFRMKIYSVLNSIYKLENNVSQIIKTYHLYFYSRNFYDSIKQKDSEQTNDAIIKYTIDELNSKSLFEKKENQIKSKLLLVTITLIFLIIILGFIFWYKSKKQQFAFNQIKNKQLDQEIKLKETTINQLHLNIHLKNSMNKIFVDNIKSLRKQKNVSTEEVLKEMQIQLSNLLQIDKNNSGLSETVDAEKMKFIETLKAKHPDLTRGELELCGYLRLELNSKEIASLMNNTVGTVRVNKTKLKAKLGIQREKTIEEYLKELMC